MKKIKSSLFISVPALKSVWSLSILIAVGFLFYACSETNNPVADSSLPGENLTLASTTVGVNSDPVVIQDFTITFNGNSYDEVANTSTFSYTVTRTSNANGFNNMAFEIPACAAEDYAGHTPLKSSSVTDNEIIWTSSLGSGSSRIHTVTYRGKKTTGMTDATIQGSGSGDTETKLIPGPCKGVYTISGFIYVDENDNKKKDSGEGGIGNATVHIAKNDNTLANKKTSANGSFSFDVFTGNTSTDFKLEVRKSSNSFLFDNFSPTTDPELIVTISNEDKSGKNLGFQAQSGKIIEEFEKEIIRLQTEKPRFWADEFKFADRGPPRILFTKTQLLSFLKKIDNDYLDLYDFKFGDKDNDRIKKAQNILTVRGNSTEIERFRAELLAAMLNVVSGNGAVDDDGNPLVEFNDLILKTGIAALISLESGANSSLMMKSTTEVISTDTITSFSTSGDLITSFNGSGGGVGSK